MAPLTITIPTTVTVSPRPATPTAKKVAEWTEKLPTPPASGSPPPRTPLATTSPRPLTPPQEARNSPDTDEFLEQRVKAWATEPKFVVPSRENHSSLDCLLDWAVKKKLSDYATLRLMSTAKPANHLTYLAAALCMDGAAQNLSGNIQTVDFGMPDLEELFYELEWRLCAKNAINHFRTMCGFKEPFPPIHEECKKVMRHLHSEWRRRIDSYGVWATAKFFIKRDESSALYLLLAHNSLYYRAKEWAYAKPIHICSPHDSFWTAYLAEDPSYMDDINAIFGKN